MGTSVVVDTDGHILEPLELWENYVEDRQFLDRAPRFFEDEDGEQLFMMDGVLLTKKGGMGVGGRNVRKKWNNTLRKQRWEEQEPGGFDPRARLTDMDEEGVDMVLLYPTIGLRFTALDDPLLAAALCRAYNKWLAAEYCSANPDRLIGTGTIPLQDPELAVKEMRFAVEKLGFRSVLIRPNPVAGRNLDHPDYAPVWQAAQDLECVVGIHEGGNVRNNNQIGQDRYKNWAYVHACAHPMEMQMALMCLCFGGVFEKYPKLKVSLLESGGGWLPFWLDRLDKHVEKLGWVLPECKQLPSFYFKRQCLIQVEADETTTPMIAQLVGEDHITFGTDYPHFDCNWLGSVEKLTSLDLSPTATRKILGENARRMYKLPAIKAHAPIAT